MTHPAASEGAGPLPLQPRGGSRPVKEEPKIFGEKYLKQYYHLLWRLEAPLPPADLRLGALDFTLDLVGTLRAPGTERCEVEDTGVLEAGEDKEV